MFSNSFSLLESSMHRGALLFLAITLLASTLERIRAYPAEDVQNVVSTKTLSSNDIGKGVAIEEKNLCSFKICQNNLPIKVDSSSSSSEEKKSVDERIKRYDAYKDVEKIVEKSFENEEKEFQRVRRASKKKGKENDDDDDDSSSSSSDDDDDDDDKNDRKKSSKRCQKSKKNNDDDDDDDNDDDDDCDNDPKQRMKSKNNNCDNDDDNDDDDNDNDDSSSSSSSSEEDKKKRTKRHIKDNDSSSSSSEKPRMKTRFVRDASEKDDNPTTNRRQNGEIDSENKSSSKEKKNDSKNSGLTRVPLYRFKDNVPSRFGRSTLRDTSDESLKSSFEKTDVRKNRFIRGYEHASKKEGKSSFSSSSAKEKHESKNRLVRSTGEDSASKLSSDEKSDKALFLILLPPYIEDVSRSPTVVKQIDKPHNRVTRSKDDDGDDDKEKNDEREEKKMKRKKRRRKTKHRRNHCTTPKPTSTTVKIDTTSDVDETIDHLLV